jgi:hypothetical protein
MLRSLFAMCVLGRGAEGGDGDEKPYPPKHKFRCAECGRRVEEQAVHVVRCYRTIHAFCGADCWNTWVNRLNHVAGEGLCTNLSATDDA